MTTEENGAPGEPVISFNDMTGPRKVPKDYQGPPLPFPDPEVKSRPRHLYKKGAAWILHLAFLLASCAVGIKDDIRCGCSGSSTHPPLAEVAGGRVPLAALHRGRRDRT